MHFKNFLTVTMLLTTAYFSLATSKQRAPSAPTSGTYYVLSDCTTPATEQVVTASNGSVIAPPGASFVDFGFPQAQLTQSMIGPVGGTVRECTVTYGEDGTNNVEDRWLYSCFENGRFKCSIFTKPQ